MVAGEDMEKLTLLVSKDERSKFLFAHAVERKGTEVNDFATKQMLKNIEEQGYRQLSMTCDQEPSTMALLQKTLKVLNVETLD